MTEEEEWSTPQSSSLEEASIELGIEPISEPEVGSKLTEVNQVVRKAGLSCLLWGGFKLPRNLLLIGLILYWFQAIYNQSRKWRKQCDALRDLNEDLRHQIDDLKEEWDNDKIAQNKEKKKLEDPMRELEHKASEAALKKEVEAHAETREILNLFKEISKEMIDEIESKWKDLKEKESLIESLQQKLKEKGNQCGICFEAFSENRRAMCFFPMWPCAHLSKLLSEGWLQELPDVPSRNSEICCSILLNPLCELVNCSL